MSKKIQVNFDDDALCVLETLKQSTRSNYGDVIRDAIGLYEWARREYEKGNAIGVIRDGVAIKEVVLPFTVLSPKPLPSKKPGKANSSLAFESH